jgi:23S rRNA (guanosine2251-2'-O)-methyltransferase
MREKNGDGQAFGRAVRSDTENKKGDRRDPEGFRPREDLVVGRNAVREALKAGRPADSLLVQRGERSGAVLPLIAECKEKGIIVKEVDQKKLDFLCGHAHHQGVILIAAAHEYATVEQILRGAEEKGEAPFLVICDSLEDPHNLGAIIRTAECCGAHGIIIPERRSVSLSGVVSKTSAGALEYVPVARVTNLNATIRELKEKNIWVVAADMDGVPYREADLAGPLALVIGSEGKGVSRLVKENCDMTVSIPMKGRINSLNASVAAAVLMFEAASKR